MKLLVPLLFLSIVFAGLFHWHESNSACQIPLAYRIGTIDEGFGIDKATAQGVVSEAESMWEDLTGRNLFTYDEEAEFTVNFVFDERQELTNREHVLREVLDQKEQLSENIKAEYEAMLGRYETLKTAFEERRAAYEQELAEYNEAVEHWNNEGGAPPDVYEELNDQKQSLNDESEALAQTTDQLNELVSDINTLGAQGNELVDDYNENVRRYNDRFEHAYEFTQGDYQGEEINIYQFDNKEELRAVLAHELGHALSLGHVDDQNAVMYYLMEGQANTGGLTDADLAEFTRVCGEG